MGAPRKFKVIIEQVKKETHEVILEGNSVMSVLDEARKMVKVRNERNKIVGNNFSVSKIEEV